MLIGIRESYKAFSASITLLVCSNTLDHFFLAVSHSRMG